MVGRVVHAARGAVVNGEDAVAVERDDVCARLGGSGSLWRIVAVAAERDGWVGRRVGGAQQQRHAKSRES